MIDLLRWLLAIELVGIAALPWGCWLLRWLPDRGYALAKVLGALCVTYLVWILGLVLPVADRAWFVAGVATVFGLCGWLLWGGETIAAVRAVRDLVVWEEALFVGGFVIWCWLRAWAFHPAIGHTEQFMDLNFLQSGLHSATYPPYDPWMSGHAINYYYFGYLLFANLTKLAGVSAAVGYNLALSTIFGLGLSGLYSLTLTLVRRRVWACAGPLFVLLIGNWHAVLAQLPNNQLPDNTTWWFFDSTRVIDNTINEFPLFSLILGDLHPHVMAWPVTLLAIAVGANLVLAEGSGLLEVDRWNVVRLGFAALIVGSLFALNSWDFPTYLLLLIASLATYGYLHDATTDWWRRPAVAGVAIAAASVALFAPFYLRFQSLSGGLGLVSTRTNPGQFIQVLGPFILPCVLLLVALGVLLRPIEAEAAEPSGLGTLHLAEKGSINSSWVFAAVAALGFITLAVAFHVFVLLAALAGFAAALSLLGRVLNTEEPNRADAIALLLLALGCLLIGLTEIVYLRDVFDGSPDYRMNTVFKFYYQAWTLLGLAGAYGAYRGWQVLRSLFAPTYANVALGVVVLGIAAGGVYTVLAPQTPVQDDGVHSLDGMAWYASAHPGDFAAITWLAGHAQPGSVELETVGDASHPDDYRPEFARIATFTGLPTVMGWPGHEDQWRPHDMHVALRVNDVRTLYSTTDAGLTRSLLRRYHVRYVVVGETEQTVYGSNSPGLAKFGRLLHAVFHHDGTTIYAT